MPPGRVRVVVVFRAEELFLGPLGPCDCFENVGEALSDLLDERVDIATAELLRPDWFHVPDRALRDVGYRAEAKRTDGLSAPTLE
jgi:hypothetical protein